MSRGDRGDAIFLDDEDRQCFLRTLGEACSKTGWEVHAWCLMSNHFHAVVETPQPNLSNGMKWLLGTFTQRFNRRHRRWGHLFGGRYKAQLIDERSPSYLAMACDYVHHNPVRAGMIAAADPLESYTWSSYGLYLRPKVRPAWLRCERLFGEHGLAGDTPRHRREFARRMEQIRRDPQVPPAIQSGWKVGAEDFADRLAERLGRRGRSGERAQERRETDEALAERLMRESLVQAGYTAGDLELLAKGDPVKIKIARVLRTRTPMSRAWIAERLRMGSPSYLFRSVRFGCKCR